MRQPSNAGRSPSNLLVVSGFWPTSANPITGIFVVQQVAALASLGFKVTVVVGNTLGRPSAPHLSVEKLGLAPELVRLAELPVARLPEKMSGIRGGLWVNVMLARRMFGHGIARLVHDVGPFNACIVHGTRYTGLSIPAWRRHVHRGVAMVMHGFDPFLANPLTANRARVFFSSAAHAVDAVVLVGKPLVLHARSLGLPLEKLHVVLNGTELPRRDSVDDAQRLQPEARRIVSISNLIPLKGIDLNLRALAEISKRRPELTWAYRIVGDGPERRRLLELAVELGIAERVRFLGRLPYEQTMREVAEADLFSLPSWGEPFGIVYLEAMARMRPVIGCLQNGPEDIVTHGKDGLLIPPRDAPALAAALEQLIENPVLCRELGRTARQTAERFTWEQNARRMLSIIGIEAGAGE